MDNSCDVIRDLLPLYVDGACSEGSRRLVEEHIAGCPACAGMLSKLRDSACEDSLRQETAAVLAPRRWRNRVFAASCTLAGFLCVPASLLAAMGRSPAMDYPFSWLLLLPPALLVALAATLLPLRCRRYTGRWTLLGYTASLMVLLLVCCAYTAEGTGEAGGATKMFFLSAAALYVLSAVVIVPWAMRQLPLTGPFAQRRWLAALAWDGWFALLIAVSAAAMAPTGHTAALLLGAAGLALMLAGTIWCLLRYLPIPRLAREGLCVTVAGNGFCWLESTVMRLAGAGEKAALWGRRTAVALLIASTAAGLAMVAVGVWRAWRQSVKKTAGPAGE